MLADILGKNRFRRLGFNIPVGRITARQAVMLNKAAEELPSESDITGVDDIELQEIAKKALGIISQIKDVQTDTEDLFENPLRELLGLDKHFRSIRGSLKVEVAKKACNLPCMQYYFKWFFVLHFLEVIFSFLMKSQGKKQ